MFSQPPQSDRSEPTRKHPLHYAAKMAASTSPDPLPRFDDAVDGFNRSHLDLVSHPENRNPVALHRVGALGQDVIGASALLREAHVAEVISRVEDEVFRAANPYPLQSVLDELGPDVDLPTRSARIQQAMTPEVTAAVSAWHREMGARLADSRSLVRLGVAYKGFSIFTRAYHDALYWLLNEKVGGSMKNALSDYNPVGMRLRATVPAFLPWFRTWRDQRNTWKGGCAYGLMGIITDIKVVFVPYDPRGAVMDFNGESVGLDDASEALRMTRTLIDALLVGEAHGHGAQVSRQRRGGPRQVLEGRRRRCFD